MKSKILFFFLMLATFDVCAQGNLRRNPHVNEEAPQEDGQESSAETEHPLALIEKINKKNILTLSKILWSTPQLVKILHSTQEALEAYGKCTENSHSQHWMKWRNSKEECGEGLSVDGFRRAVIQKHFTKAVNEALKALGLPQVAWNAIGTQGASSDIDIVACASDDENEQVKLTEITAKILFDTLGVALYEKTTGETFDTESYVDVTKGLGAEYKELIQDKVYQDLAFTLSQVQVFRQLEHPILFKDKPIFSWKNYIDIWKNTPFAKIVSDAQQFNEYGKPLESSLENLGHYLPITHHLSEAFYKVKTPLEQAVITGVQGTYFPEAYFTKESLKHVCYSDDRYSQFLLAHIRNKLETKDALTAEDVDTFIKEEQLGGVTPFVYAVSAGENIGYFLHKINETKETFDALVNSSKYLFRVARALCSYVGVDTDAPPKKWKNPSQEYAYKLFEVSSKFERLKRGVIPFTTQKDIHNILYGALKSFKIPTASLETLSHAIYDLFMKQWAKTNVKKEAMSDLGVAIHRFGVFWDEESASYETDDINDLEKKEAAHQLIALLNLAIGAESKIPEEQKSKERAVLQETASLPLWQKDGTIAYKKIAEASFNDFKDFVVGLISFYRDVIIKDYGKTAHHTFSPIHLRDKIEEILKKP